MAPDLTDPFVALLAWVLLWGATKYAPQLRRLAPLAAVLLACGLRAGWDAVQGEALSWEVLGRGLLAGGAAVVGHSQVREVLKMAAETPAEGG